MSAAPGAGSAVAEVADGVAEAVLGIDRGGARLWGILARPTRAPASETAVLVVVGGPQYRAGSHRMFVSLCRRLAAAGHPALRFDYAGMGDSDGPLPEFRACGPDLRAALDAVSTACPDVRRIVVWGLCDAASAALIFMSDDPRVAGIVAVNPWARSEATLAAARVRHYYAARLLQADFWRKLLGGGLRWRESLQSLAGDLRRARARPAAEPADASVPFQTRMAHGLARLRGSMLLILSGNDLTAKEFLQCVEGSPAWRGLLDDPKVRRVDLADADHTLSRRSWLAAAENETLAWLRDIGAPAGPAAHP
jgi:exosortase A-associated hydrolase 1